VVVVLREVERQPGDGSGTGSIIFLLIIYFVAGSVGGAGLEGGRTGDNKNTIDIFKMSKAIPGSNSSRISFITYFRFRCCLQSIVNNQQHHVGSIIYPSRVRN
jgi:hypothetical protein